MGKYRHLTQATTAEGHFVILAVDHRGNLIDNYNQYRDTPATDEEFTQFKQDLMRAILPVCSAVLADPVYAIGRGIATRTIPSHTAILSPIEVTDYSPHPSQRATHFIPHWSVAKTKQVGGAGIKMLLYYHPDDSQAQEKRELVEQIIQQCADADIPYYLEPIAYSLDADHPIANNELRQVVVETARTFSQMGVDILKAQFPLDVSQEPDETVWADALAELTSACGDVPWALLSAGVDYDIFKRQTRLACQAGASGIIVGRALWTEAIQLDGQERQDFLESTAQQRMNELADICAQHATAWYDKVAPPASPTDWLNTYFD